MFANLTRLTLGATLCLLLGTSPAAAAPMTVKFLGNGSGVDVTITDNGNTMSGFAGQFEMQSLNSQGQPTGSTFLSYCVDLLDDLQTNNVGSVQPTSTLNHGAAIAYLYQTFGQTSLSNEQAAAFQVALWYEEYDNGTTSGPFRFDSYYQGATPSNFDSLVDGYLTDAVGQSASGLWLNTDTPGGAGQGVLLPQVESVPQDPPPDPPPDPPTVPEPSTLALLGLGGAALAAWRWRRRTQLKATAASSPDNV